jgi:hypothetical protein
MEEVQICIRGHIERSWAGRLNYLTVYHTVHGETLLTGMMPDQSAIYGLLNKLSNLGLQLISVSCWRLQREQTIEGGDRYREKSIEKI